MIGTRCFKFPTQALYTECDRLFNRYLIGVPWIKAMWYLYQMPPTFIKLTESTYYNCSYKDFEKKTWNDSGNAEIFLVWRKTSFNFPKKVKMSILTQKNLWNRCWLIILCHFVLSLCVSRFYIKISI